MVDLYQRSPPHPSPLPAAGARGPDALRGLVGEGTGCCSIRVYLCDPWLKLSSLSPRCALRLIFSSLRGNQSRAGLVVDQEFGDYQFGPLTEKSAVWIHRLKIRIPSPGHAQRRSGHGRGG